MRENIIHFTLRQMQHIRRGGFSTLVALLRRLLLTIAVLPIVLVARLLKPVVVIRFGQLWSDRIGHFVRNTELYLCERDAGMHPQKTFDIFGYRSKICNQQLKKMWDRTLHTSWIGVGGYWLNRLLPGGERYLVSIPSDRDIHDLLDRTPVPLTFTDEEEGLGRKALEKMGISKDVPFVCLYARDSAYLKNIYPNENWHYHKFRDTSIHNYMLAAEELGRRGYFVIRIGNIVKEPLVATSSKIIDYASQEHRSDLLDIYLGAKCHFFLGTPAGISAIPGTFKRPLAFVNYVPMEYMDTWFRSNIFIPKKFWLKAEQRFMTFREILDSGAGRFLRGEQYEQYGIELIENTPEEIMSLAVEMEERLAGVWQSTEEDEGLQRRFWSFWKPGELNQVFRARIGAEFLRQNQELLR